MSRAILASNEIDFEIDARVEESCRRYNSSNQFIIDELL